MSTYKISNDMSTVTEYVDLTETFTYFVTKYLNKEVPDWNAEDPENVKSVTLKELLDYTIQDNYDVRSILENRENAKVVCMLVCSTDFGKPNLVAVIERKFDSIDVNRINLQEEAALKRIEALARQYGYSVSFTKDCFQG